MSNSAQVDPTDRVFQRRRYPRKPILATSEVAAVAAPLAEMAEIVCIGRSADDLPALMAYLGSERGVRRLVCEGGAILNFHMLRVGLVDEFFRTVTPSIIGEPRTRKAVEGDEVLSPEDVMSLELISMTEAEGEVFLRYRAPSATPHGGA